MYSVTSLFFCTSNAIKISVITAKLYKKCNSQHRLLSISNVTYVSTNKQHMKFSKSLLRSILALPEKWLKDIISFKMSPRAVCCPASYGMSGSDLHGRNHATREALEPWRLIEYSRHYCKIK
jgi:hypothetical protein